jgi:molybdenum cofactor biosynthesis enzyme MoaA
LTTNNEDLNKENIILNSRIELLEQSVKAMELKEMELNAININLKSIPEDDNIELNNNKKSTEQIEILKTSDNGGIYTSIGAVRQHMEFMRTLPKANTLIENQEDRGSKLSSKVLSTSGQSQDVYSSHLAKLLRLAEDAINNS